MEINIFKKLVQGPRQLSDIGGGGKAENWGGGAKYRNGHFRIIGYSKIIPNLFFRIQNSESLTEP